MAVAAEPVHVRIRVRVSMGAGAQDDVEVLVAVEVAEGDVRRLLSAGFDARDSRAWRLRPTQGRRTLAVSVSAQSGPSLENPGGDDPEFFHLTTLCSSACTVSTSSEPSWS